jgi:hypothetical protein
VCYWEDDGSDNHCLDEPSYENQMTLRQARTSFLRTGVCDGVSRYVRPPTVVEIQLRRFDDNGEEISA